MRDGRCLDCRVRAKLRWKTLFAGFTPMTVIGYGTQLTMPFALVKILIRNID